MINKVSSKISYAEVLGIVSAWFCIIGAFLPWAKKSISPSSSVTLMGMETIGGFTLFFGIICFLLFYLERKNRQRIKTILGILLLGILLLFLMLNNASNITSTTSYGQYSYYDYPYYGVYQEISNDIELDIGFFLTIYGSIGLIISGIWLFIEYQTITKK